MDLIKIKILRTYLKESKVDVEIVKILLQQSEVFVKSEEVVVYFKYGKVLIVGWWVVDMNNMEGLVKVIEEKVRDYEYLINTPNESRGVQNRKEKFFNFIVSQIKIPEYNFLPKVEYATDMRLIEFIEMLYKTEKTYVGMYTKIIKEFPIIIPNID